MVSESVTQSYDGVEGFKEAWSDWLSPYEGFRIELDEVVPFDDRLLFLVRQVATTQHNAVEIETPSAAVWWLEDGQIRQAGLLPRPTGGDEGGRVRPRPPVHRLTTPRPGGRRACGGRP